jgi:hypothetical protein
MKKSSRFPAPLSVVTSIASLLVGRPLGGNKDKDDDDDLPRPNATVPMMPAFFALSV